MWLAPSTLYSLVRPLLRLPYLTYNEHVLTKAHYHYCHLLEYPIFTFISISEAGSRSSSGT